MVGVFNKVNIQEASSLIVTPALIVGSTSTSPDGLGESGTQKLLVNNFELFETEWHIYASVNYDIIGSDNDLSPDQCQTIIWTNTVILSIGPLGTHFSGILIGIDIFSFKKMPLKMTSAVAFIWMQFYKRYFSHQSLQLAWKLLT